jgi:hypothetical protein
MMTSKDRSAQIIEVALASFARVFPPMPLRSAQTLFIPYSLLPSSAKCRSRTFITSFAQKAFVGSAN